MRKNPAKITDFLGLNNVLDPEDVQLGELQTAINYDVTNNRKLKPRQGTQLVHSCTPHSLFSDGTTMCFREGAALKMRGDDGTITILRNDFTSSAPVSYLGLNGLIYYTDGSLTGVVQDGVNRSWGLVNPQAPTLTPTVGLLPSGRYQVALTYMRNDGQESGSLVAATVDVTEGGIEVSNIPISSDPTVERVLIYMSTADGEVLYRAMVVANGTMSAIYRGDGNNLSSPLVTAHLSAPPPGQLIAHHNGRVYIAQGSILWYTEPFMYELVSLAHNFLPLPGRITMLAPVKDGIWVGTDRETVYIPGKDPEVGMEWDPKANYGVIEGTPRLIDGQVIGTDNMLKGNAWIWCSTKGFCVGGNDGLFINLTEGRFTMPDGVAGAGLVRRQDGIDQYVVSLFIEGSNSSTITLPAVEGDSSGQEAS